MAESSGKRDQRAWLLGGSTVCTAAPTAKLPLRIVLMGAPGIGKGTQAELLSAALGACALSTGDIFRAAKAQDPAQIGPALSAALDYMKRGDLVPDDTVLDVLRERKQCLTCGGGFLLDGFPRTQAQAEALGATLEDMGRPLHVVISYELPIETITTRLSGRRVCPGCKAVYHVETRPPKRPGVCDGCGGTLVQREDDRPEAVRVRMEVHARTSAPVIDLYEKQGLLVRIEASGSPEQILKRTLSQLEKRGIPALS